MKKLYEIKYKKLPSNLNMVQIELKNKIVIYINENKNLTEVEIDGK